MRAQVVPKPLQPGHAVLRLLDLGAQPEGLTLRFERRSGAERFLSENGWQKSEAWLEPERIERSRDALDFHIGPVVGDVLAGTTVRVAVREPGIGTVGETVVAWPSMLTSGAYDPSRVVREEAVGRTTRPSAPPPPPPPEPAPEPAPPPPPERIVLSPLRAEPLIERERAQPTKPARRVGFVFLLLALAAIAAGVWHFWPWLQVQWQQQVAARPAAAPIEKPLRLEVSEFLAGKPSNEQILAKGRDYLAAGKPDGAFLVWRAAADAGDPPASLAFGGFYDPVTAMQGSPVPVNGETAALWYERAARGELPEAMRRLGLLYAKGHTTLPADKAKARDWLKRAADKGDQAAKQELDKLK
jgi:hypothetical protein